LILHTLLEFEIENGIHFTFFVGWLGCEHIHLSFESLSEIFSRRFWQKEYIGNLSFSFWNRKIKMALTSTTSCDCNRSRCRRLRQVVYDESETNYTNIENANANGVQYFESLESLDPRSGSESEAIQTQSLSTEISEPERTTTIASNKRILTILQLRFHLSFLQSRTIFIFIFLFFFRFLFLQWEWRCVTFRSITFRFWKNF